MVFNPGTEPCRDPFDAAGSPRALFGATLEAEEVFVVPAALFAVDDAVDGLAVTEAASITPSIEIHHQKLKIDHG